MLPQLLQQWAPLLLPLQLFSPLVMFLPRKNLTLLTRGPISWLPSARVQMSLKVGLSSTVLADSQYSSLCPSLLPPACLSFLPGLRKVTDSMKTHKNPELRASSMVKASSDKPTKAAPKYGTAASTVKKSPVLELQNKRWVVVSVCMCACMCVCVYIFVYRGSVGRGSGSVRRCSSCLSLYTSSCNCRHISLH